MSPMAEEYLLQHGIRLNKKRTFVLIFPLKHIVMKDHIQLNKLDSSPNRNEFPAATLEVLLDGGPNDISLRQFVRHIK